MLLSSYSLPISRNNGADGFISVLNRRLLCASGKFEANEGESNCLDDASVSNFKHKRSGTHGNDI
jgi:hypothetical protein